LGEEINPREAEYRAMMKKKAKGKTTTKKTAKKKSSPRGKRERNPLAVHDDIAKIVEQGAKEITKAVMEQAKAGQLGPAKYLLEMAEIYPLATDGSFSTADEESLAATLLRRLDIPDEPVTRDEEDAPKTVSSPKLPADEDEKSESGAKLEACEEDKEAVLV
jgi:hypothetical protein